LHCISRSFFAGFLRRVFSEIIARQFSALGFRVIADCRLSQPQYYATAVALQALGWLVTVTPFFIIAIFASIIAAQYYFH